jgi:ubiquinone/menaquinone biosynthesis C-methylase UbiE
VADLIDLQLSQLGLAAIEALGPVRGETIIDVGCGAGQTLMQLASRLGPTGHVIGVDISPHLLAIARNRTSDCPQVTLIECDAATLPLPDGSANGIYSRFGVMALDDSVAAFSNFRRMLKTDGRLGFVCWQSLAENELDYLPLYAARLDCEIDETPFTFEKSDFITEVLKSAGFRHISIKQFDAQVSSSDLEAMLKVLTKVGPLGRILRGKPELLAVAVPRVRAALAERTIGHSVSLTAASWIVTASAKQ